MQNNKPVIQFDCSFCGHIWELQSPKYKESVIKTTRNIIYKSYTSNCPDCGRETTIYKEQRR